MGYGLIVADPPTEEPVTVDEAKEHLVVSHDDDDALIGRLISAARQQTEVETGRRWVTQTLTLSLSEFPRVRCFVTHTGVVPSAIPLISEPVSEVSAVRYYDMAGVQRTLAEDTDYLTWLSHSPPLVYPAPGHLWPLTQVGRYGGVEVDFVAGYGDASAVPEAAKQAILLAVGFWYENRGDAEDPTVCGLPPAALRLCRSLSTGAYS